MFPPEIGEPASYVKELAGRLSKDYQVTVVMYGRLPEKVSGVSFICVDKRKPLLLRLLRFYFVLLKEAKTADILYAENGGSVELPAGFVAFFISTPLFIHTGDIAVMERIKNSKILKYIQNFAFKRARKVISEIPLERPEIMPFGLKPQKEMDVYFKSWDEHISKLKNIFSNV